jgi:hypothetical protein
LFPPIQELQYLVGTELTQVIVDPFQVRFLLVNNLSATTLTSGYAFEFADCNGRSESYRPCEKCSDFSPIQFHQLLNDKVSAVDLSADGLRLTLAFELGTRLTILSVLDGYEAGTIACGGGSKRFWVF